MDVDGTLTDGKIYMGNNGEVFKVFNIRDGYGIHDMLLTNGIVPIIITGRKSKIVENRCKELEIKEVYQGVQDKLSCLEKILELKKSTFSKVAYIGDDLNDLQCMKAVKSEDGVVACPADAIEDVKNIADFVGTCKGGDGAVREFIEWILFE